MGVLGSGGLGITDNLMLFLAPLVKLYAFLSYSWSNNEQVEAEKVEYWH